MDRATSCWDASLILAQLLFLLAATTDRTAVAGTVIFPDHDSCTLDTGETGRCLPLTDCPPVLQTFKEKPPVQCGFEGFTQIVCCPKDQDTTSQQLVDISPPSGYSTLNCGKSATKTIQTFGPSGSGTFIRQEQARVPGSLGPTPQPEKGSLDSIPRPGKGSLGPLPLPGKGSLIPPNQPTVVGGQISLRAAWPWMALLGRRDAAGISWFCGGALINKQWVLTALHCFHRFGADVVRLGEHDYNNNNDQANHIDFDVAETVLYPDYKRPEAYHDLALLKLDREVKLQTFILPVCLPWGNKSEENIVNTAATIVGWGVTLFGGLPSSVLMEAEVQVFPSSRCDGNYSSLPDYPRTWPHGIGKENLCAGDPEGGKDSCQGDSGGPMVIKDSRDRYVAAGVVSRGFGCGHKDYPGLYANLRYPPYLAWIKKVAFGPQ